METLTALFLGIIQGATEFLPVSSSGHLFLVEQWLGLSSNIELMIVTHVATLGAVLIIFWRQVWDLLRGFFASIVNRKLNPEGDLALKLGLATILTVVVALLIEPWFGELLNLRVVAFTLLITGVLIVIAEKFRRSETRDLTWPIAISLGVVQGLAVVPGLSRSGLTIAFLILLGLNRRRSAELSFLLSIPTILGAGIYLIADTGNQFVLTQELMAAALAAFVTALVMIYTMLKLVEKHWIWFAPYCIGLGLFLFLI